MNIGVFYPALNVYGGAEYVTVIMANALAKAGHEVTLFSNDPVNQAEINKYFSTKLSSSTKVIVKTTKIKPRSLLDFYQTILKSYAFKNEVDTWIDCYSNRMFPWTNISYIHFPFFNHVCYNSSFPYLKNKRISTTAFLPNLLLEKSFFNKNQMLIANSYYTADEIKLFLNKSSFVIYPPVPADVFEGNVEAKRENLVVTISRFSNNKGLEKIVNIAALAPENVKFAVIGRIHNQAIYNDLKNTIKKQGLSNKIALYPDLSKSQLKLILHKAKVYLHLMEGEHFGISIVEGMAAGCTPVVHNSGGQREFVPKDNLYNDDVEAVEKVSFGVKEWCLRKAMENREMAEMFREEKFAEQFMKMVDVYHYNKIGSN
jgi:glycosyltransferase involved in cell wall biosynthesis